MKKQRPILFNSEMVRAILEGNKTMTRRTKGLDTLNNDEKKWVYSHNSLDGHVPRPAKKYDDSPWYLFHLENSNDQSWVMQCPYGKPGDILWVRETSFKNGDEFIYLADGTCCEQFEQCECLEVGKPKWKPSIHMPKEACRIFLKIVSVRVERLHGISEDDAQAEGIECHERETDWMAAKFGFQLLWKKINGEESWESNPWVWVVEFKRIEKPM